MPLPLPDGVTVHHVWLLATVQLQFDVTENEVEPAGVYATFWLAGVTVKVHGAAACVRVTTIGVTPETVTVMFAVRALVVVLAV